MGYYSVLTTKTKGAWVKQYRKAMNAMRKKGYRNLDEFADKDPVNCGKLLQAADALGAGVDPALAKKCGLRWYMEEGEI
jgi:hypothetical protein